jgi:hypothetical protein
VSVRESIRYAVLPGVRRDDVLANPAILDALVPGEHGNWWRLSTVTPPGP